jgi:hypothetical protein
MMWIISESFEKCFDVVLFPGHSDSSILSCFYYKSITDIMVPRQAFPVIVQKPSSMWTYMVPF